MLGVYLLQISRAAVAPASVETETGTVGSSALKVNDSRASGGAAVQFTKSTTVAVETFDATGDGVTDDGAAIQRALDALHAGQTLVFAANKTYLHNDVLHVTTAGVTLSGGGSIKAANEQASTLEVAADNVAIKNLTFKMGATTQRWGAPAQTMVFLNQHQGDSVQSVLIDGSPSAGLFIFGASNYNVSDVTVQNTRADAIHNTYGAHDGTIIRPIIKNAGDDGVAVVSYKQDGAICHDITVTSPKFYGSTNGRAYSVVGGSNITFTSLYADSSNAAGIYIGSEGNPYYTYGTDNVLFDGGTISNANTNSSVDHGTILILGGNSDTLQTNIIVKNLAISNTRASASRQISLLNYSGTMSRIDLENITISGGGSTAFGQLNVPPAAYNTLNWTQNGAALADHRGF